MKRLPFIFATREDMIALDKAVQQRARVKYILTEPLETTSGRAFERLEAIPGVGEVRSGRKSGGVCCVILPAAQKPSYRRIRRNDGSTVWVADETGNDDAVFLWSPGIYEAGRALIAGHIATSFGTPVAQGTIRAFNSAMRTTFSKRGKVFVGPEALRLALAGWRCAFDATSPGDYDVPVATVDR